MDKLLAKIFNGNDNWLNSYPNLTVIVGNAESGPALTPIFVKTLSDFSRVQTLFGINSDLLNGFYEACDDVTDICLIKLNGNHREINIHDCIFLKSISTEEIYNQINVSTYINDNNQAILEFSKDNYRQTYVFDNESVSDLCARINSDAAIGACFFTASYNLEDRNLKVSTIKERILQYEEKMNKINANTIATSLGTKIIEIEDIDGKKIEIEVPYEEVNINDNPNVYDASFKHTGIRADGSNTANLEDRLRELLHNLEGYDIVNIDILNFAYNHRLTNKFFIYDIKDYCLNPDEALREAAIPPGYKVLSLNNSAEETNEEEPQHKANSIYEIEVNTLDGFKVGEQCYFLDEKYPLNVCTTSISTDENGNIKYTIIAACNFVEALTTGYVDYISQPGQYLYEYLSDYLYNREKYLTPTFVNIGNLNHDGVKDEADRFLVNLPPLSKCAYINIIIDTYKTNIYNGDTNNYYSNGVCLLSKAISNIENWDNVIGYNNSVFYEYVKPNDNNIFKELTDKEKLDLNLKGVISTNQARDRLQKISSGSNLLIKDDIVLNTVGNVYLVSQILRSIDSSVTIEMSDAEIQRAVETVLSRYGEVLSSYFVAVSSELQKNIINKTVNIELYVVGYLKKIKLAVEVI